jgi:hypothetical protein
VASARGREKGGWAGGWSLGQAGPWDVEGRKGKEGFGFFFSFFFFLFQHTINKTKTTKINATLSHIYLV